MATQMQALDDFVTRARTQNENHHISHIQSLEPLGLTVKDSYSAFNDAITASHSRISQLGSDISTQTTSLQSNLPSLGTEVRDPLTTLRESISTTQLTEYNPTGETPQKTQYTYPSMLPRTEPRDKLLSALTDARATTFPSALVPSAPPSPSKGLIYTDTPRDGITVIPPPASDGSRPSIIANIATTSTSNTGLREVHPNISRSSDPLSLNSVSNTGKPDVEILSSSTMTRGPPPLKRLATETRLPKGMKGRAEGRENLPEGGRSGRRLRSAGSD